MSDWRCRNGDNVSKEEWSRIVPLGAGLSEFCSFESEVQVIRIYSVWYYPRSFYIIYWLTFDSCAVKKRGISFQELFVSHQTQKAYAPSPIILRNRLFCNERFPKLLPQWTHHKYDLNLWLKGGEPPHPSSPQHFTTGPYSPERRFLQGAIFF
jgi:hypothetical protein